jgi:predicted ATPase/class 3 adenylate cyclase
MHNLVPRFILEKFQQQQFKGSFSTVALFVDVSGFTPITEILVQYGKAGAETLAGAMLAIFAPLVNKVYEHGGFIAFYAGDAFVALFPGQANIVYQRALLAAWQMRRQMAATPSYLTPYGSFTLAVKASLADGEVNWGIWHADLSSASGSSQQCASYFGGEAIERSIQAEQYAGGNEVLISQGVYQALRQIKAGALQAKPVATVSGETIFRVTAIPPEILALSPDPVATFPEADARAEFKATAAKFFPSDLLELPAQGEFRQALTLFINLQRMPDDDSNFVKNFFLLLNQYGGYLCRVGRIGAQDVGGSLLLFWGAPTGRENDLERALNFVLDLRSNTDIPFRAGLTRHLLYAGFIGSSRREEYTCYGLGVNLAARQMVSAPWASIWLDEETARQAEAYFEVKLVGRLSFKGFAEKQPVFILVGPKEARLSLFPQGQLIGRDHELEQLRRAIEPLFQGQFAGIVVVMGEAGIGKSRLLHEFKQGLQQSQNRPLTWCDCPTDEILRQSLNPFRYFLRTYFEQSAAQTEAENKARFNQKLDRLMSQIPDPLIRQEVDRTRSCLGALVGLTWPDSLFEQLDPQLRFENSLEALKNLFKAESLGRPVIINIEDMHWLDQDSRQFIQRFCRNISAYPVALILSSRDELESGWVDPTTPFQAIRLQPFSIKDIQHFVEERLSNEVAATMVSVLAERTQGNPFFIEQMLLYLQKQGVMGRETRLNSTDITELIPSNIRALLISRLDRLAPAVKQVVQTAAVLGQKFEFPVLARMLPEESNVIEAVKSAEAEAIWTTVGQQRYLFRHVLLRDAAYEMQLHGRLRVLHRRAAEAIERVYRPNLAAYYADLAHHYDQAGSQVEAIGWYKLAGERAAGQHANNDAVVFFSRALALIQETDLAGRYELLLARENIYDISGIREAQAQDLEILGILAERLADNRRRAEAALRRASYANATGNYTTAIVSARRAIELAQSSQAISLEIGGYSQWGRALGHLGHFKPARRQLRQVLVLARANQLPQIEASSLRSLGIIALNQGHYTHEVITILQQALDIFRRINDRRGESNSFHTLGLTVTYQGDYTLAKIYFEQALRLCREIGGRKEEGWTLNNLGVALDYQGDYTRARSCFEQALSIFREIDDRRGEGTTLSNLGLLAHHLADDRAAEEYCRQALLIFQKIGELHMRGFALTFLGHALTGQGYLAEALDAYRQALALRRDLKQPHMALDPLAGLARLSLIEGEPAQAQLQVEGILSHLEANPTLHGADEPLRIYLTCYHVLRTNQDLRAQDILKVAHQLLLERAARLENDEMRHLYLQGVAAHREILSEVARRQNNLTSSMNFRDA